MVTDGDKEGADGEYVELAPGKQWVQIDLEKASDVYAVLVWHYHAEGRVYHGVVVQLSNDPEFKTGVTTVYNNDFDNAHGLGGREAIGVHRRLPRPADRRPQHEARAGQRPLRSPLLQRQHLERHEPLRRGSRCLGRSSAAAAGPIERL